MAFYLTTLERRDLHQMNLPAAMDQAGVARYLDNARSDPLKQAIIRSYLSLHELLATGVNLCILDEEVIFRFANSSIIAIWNNYAPWIYEQRKERAEPSVFCELVLRVMGNGCDSRSREAAPLAAVSPHTFGLLA